MGKVLCAHVETVCHCKDLYSYTTTIVANEVERGLDIRVSLI